MTYTQSIGKPTYFCFFTLYYLEEVSRSFSYTMNGCVLGHSQILKAFLISECGSRRTASRNAIWCSNIWGNVTSLSIKSKLNYYVYRGDQWSSNPSCYPWSVYMHGTDGLIASNGLELADECNWMILLAFIRLTSP